MKHVCTKLTTGVRGKGQAFLPTSVQGGNTYVRGGSKQHNIGADFVIFWLA